ncbi:MAG: SIS domain-containing protein [Treponema sp.]|jgi:arabinose-5-phosphate isomerase|nr:SIS domain-containing protein [Treponema sp.]
MIKYFDRQIAVVGKCFANLPADDFDLLAERCVGALRRGGKIIASGLGKNVPICEKFVGTLNSLGLDARFLHTNSAVHGDLGMVRGEDIVLLLSKSGNTEETITLGQLLLERKTETWPLVFNGNSRLISLFKRGLLLKLEEEGDPWNILPNNSTVVYLLLLQGLAMRIARDMNVHLEDFRLNHPGGGIGKQLRKETC